jgi:hypothetical protein
VTLRMSVKSMKYYKNMYDADGTAKVGQEGEHV